MPDLHDIDKALDNDPGTHDHVEARP